MCTHIAVVWLPCMVDGWPVGIAKIWNTDWRSGLDYGWLRATAMHCGMADPKLNEAVCEFEVHADASQAGIFMDCGRGNRIEIQLELSVSSLVFALGSKCWPFDSHNIRMLSPIK